MEPGERQMTKRKDEIDKVERKLRRVFSTIEGGIHKENPREYMRNYMKAKRSFEYAKKVKPSLFFQTMAKIRKELEELLEDIERLKRTDLCVSRKKGGT